MQQAAHMRHGLQFDSAAVTVRYCGLSCSGSKLQGCHWSEVSSFPYCLVAKSSSTAGQFCLNSCGGRRWQGCNVRAQSTCQGLVASRAQPAPGRCDCAAECSHSKNVPAAAASLIAWDQQAVSGLFNLAEVAHAAENCAIDRSIAPDANL